MISANTATQAGRGPYKSAQASLIGRLRRQQGMTQAQASKHCNVSLRTFQRAESGDALPRTVKRDIERRFGMTW